MRKSVSTTVELILSSLSSNVKIDSVTSRRRSKMFQFGKPARVRQVLSVAKGISGLTSAQRVALSSSASAGKLYELRTYNIKPAHMVPYVQLTREKFHLRTAHSKLCGFWVTELGGVNESVHLWEYDSLAHRASVRAALGADDNWKQEYLSKAFQYFDKQHNAVVKCAWGSVETTSIQKGGIYHLQVLHLKSAGLTGKPAMKKVKQLTNLQQDIVEEKQMGKLIAALSTEIGETHTVYQIWNYRHIDDVLKIKTFLEEHPSVAASENIVKKTVSKLLIPVPDIAQLD